MSSYEQYSLRSHQLKRFTLQLYIAKELFLYFLVLFFFFFSMFFVNQFLLLAKTILRQRVPVPDVLLLIWYSLPAIIAQSAPFATLVGFLMCLGRMASDNEIMVLRATGQRYSVILLPVLVMGAIISLFSFVMNDYFLPLGNINYLKLQRQIVVSNPGVQIESNTVKRMNKTALVMGEAKDNHVDDLIILDSSQNNQLRIICAKDVDAISTTFPGVLLTLSMHSPVVFQLDTSDKASYDLIDADTMSYNVFDSVILSDSNGVSPREMTSHDLKSLIKSYEADGTFTKLQLNSYYLEYYKKFSIPFGSVFFALLALPLALLFGKKNGQVVGMIIGVVISFLYWAATMIGQQLGYSNGFDGFWTMWTPNVVIGALGVWLYLRLRRS
ncbi:MAG TPA: YjgP/YjgQ family permease [Treponema sp.]|nr:YjgP/YjgQ family permease [Treponema sp.]